MPVRITQDNYDRVRKLADKFRPKVTLGSLVNEIIRQGLPTWEKKAK